MAEKVKIRQLLPGNLSLRTSIPEKLVTKFANTQKIRRFAEVQARAAELLENSKIRRALAEEEFPMNCLTKKQ